MGSRFNDTFNILLGTTNKHIDWFNNPYIEPVVYLMDESYSLIVHEDIQLKICTREDLLEFVTDFATVYYQNALCLQDKSKFVLKGSWFDNTFQSVFYSIDRCRNTTANNNWCKPAEEIDNFVSENLFYIVT